jgi:hypothetical protein
MRTRLALLLLLLATNATAWAKGTLPRQYLKERPRVVDPEPQKRGRWHMAEDGHAVFCYGPVLTINALFGDPKRVATECRGRSPNVALHD